MPRPSAGISVFAALCFTCTHAYAATSFEAEFVAVGRPRADMHVPFTVGLPVNSAAIEDVLARIANPLDASYGNWLSQQEAIALTSSSPATRAEVLDWLSQRGAACVDRPHALLCNASVSSIEAAFQTSLTEFKQLPRGNLIVRTHPTAAFVLPSSLKGKMIFVSHLTDFPSRRTRLGTAVMPISAGDPSLVVAPESLAALYRIWNANGSAASTVSPVEFLSQSAFSIADQDNFAASFGLPQWRLNVTHGTFAGSSPESTLDAAYVYAVAPNNSQQFWTDPGWIFEFAQELLVTPNPARVYSISYGESVQAILAVVLLTRALRCVSHVVARLGV